MKITTVRFGVCGQSSFRTARRAVEQVLIDLHGLGKNGGTLINKINSIARDNPIFEDAMKRGAEILKHSGSLGV